MKQKIPLIFSLVVVLAVVSMLGYMAMNESDVEIENKELESLRAEIAEIKAIEQAKQQAEIDSLIQQTQTSKGLLQSSRELTSSLSSGDSDLINWKIGVRLEEATIKLFVSGQGSEFITIPNEVTINDEFINVPIQITIPDNAKPGNYDIMLHAIKDAGRSGSTQLNIEMLKQLTVEVIQS